MATFGWTDDLSSFIYGGYDSNGEFHDGFEGGEFGEDYEDDFDSLDNNDFDEDDS